MDSGGCVRPGFDRDGRSGRTRAQKVGGGHTELGLSPVWARTTTGCRGPSGRTLPGRVQNPKKLGRGMAMGVWGAKCRQCRNRCPKRACQNVVEEPSKANLVRLLDNGGTKCAPVLWGLERSKYCTLDFFGHGNCAVFF